MLKTVNDVPVPKNSRKNVCLVFSEIHVSKTNRVKRFFNGILIGLKNLKETRFAQRTDLLNDQTLDKTARPDKRFAQRRCIDWLN